MSSPPPSLKGLSAVKLALMAQQVRAQSQAVLAADPIAIVGMACRLPGGADSPDAFWQLLKDGREAIRDVPAERWNADAWFSDDPSSPGKSMTRQGGFLDQVDGFDAGYFGILPREAERMDPQQRLLLEVAVEAFDDAGLSKPRLAGSRTGVFIASYHNDYAQLQYNDPQAIDARSLTGMLHSVLANRVSYLLDLRGPSLSIDTACSSSLVATHLACQSLRHGETDVALAGGVSLMLTPDLMVALSKVGFMAPDGRCKTFDELADGFGRGEGCAVVVLKRLSDAVADGDRVLAVVRGSAVNSDGHSTLLAAPNGLAQQAMVREALANAQLDASRIGFVEAHGTGTQLGDPIEVEALAATVGRPAADAGTCYLGAAKANIGHLEAAAGAVGLIKTVLALQHEAVPPQPNFRRLSPHISLAGTRLAVASALTAWPRTAQPRCGAVSSFGVGGTNAHVIVEEAPLFPAEADESAADAPRLLALSAHDPAALRAVAQQWIDFLPATGAGLLDLCYTANERRTHHDCRLALVGRSRADFATRLQDFLADAPAAGLASGRVGTAGRPPLAFVFSGQGPQWFAMGRELLAAEPVFRERMAECDALLRPLSGWSLLDELNKDEAASRLDETEVAQPALFALQVSLAALWASWGVVPDAVVGHSIGEIAALQVAGVLGLPEAVRVVWHRGRTMQQATGLGRMASVGLDAEAARRLLQPHGDSLSIGAVNGPRSVVLSGDAVALEAVLAILTAQGVSHRMLPVQYAFHSAQMAPFQQRLVDELAGIVTAAPRVPVYSTVEGERLQDAPTAAYFGRNVREPVRFAEAVAALARDGFDLFLEIGPHPVLGVAVQECLASQETPPRVLASLRRGRPERETLLQACAGLHATGVSPDWEALSAQAGQVVSLPAYPWQRKRHWIRKTPAPATGSAGVDTGHPLLGRRLATAVPRTGIFEGDAAASQAWLAEHRIFGRLLMPAAAVLEMFDAAARQMLGRAAVQVDGFAMLRPLEVAEDAAEPSRWQTVATLEGERVDIELHQALPGSGGWQRVATASATASSAAIAWPAADFAASTPVDADAFHARFAELGVAFGPAFRRLQGLRRGEGRAQATLAAEALPGHALHPALIDAALQLCSAAIGPDATGALPARVWLPLGADRFQLAAAAAGTLHAEARVQAGPGGSTLSADVRIVGADGATVLALEGLRFAPAEAGASAADDSLYDVVWQRAAAPSVGASPAGHWLLLADAGGTADALAHSLAQQGARCTLLRPGRELARTVDMAWTLDPAEPSHFAQLLPQLGPLQGVVHLWALDAATFDFAGADDAVLAVGSALHLVQALVATTPAPLFFATRGAQAVSGTEAPAQLQPRAAGLPGLAGVVAAEHPELQVRCIDLDPAEPDRGASALLTELLSPTTDARVAWRGGERWWPRLQRHRGSTGSAAAVQLRLVRPGTLDGAQLQPLQRQPLRDGDVRLRVRASGVNFRDVLLTLGMYHATGVPLGAECAGVVVECGRGVHGLKVGDEVFGYAPGSMATEVAVPEAFLARVPAGMRAEDAAALPVAYLTAHHGLHGLARLQRGDRVLIHAAAGGVGLAAVQLALRAGAEVFATAGSLQKRAMLSALGVVHVMDSRSLTFADDVRQATGGKGIDVVLNSLAGEFIAASLGVLAPEGCFLELGKRDILTAEDAAALRPDVRYFAYDLGSQAQADLSLLRPMFDDLLAGLADGSLRPLPVTSFPMARAQDAFRHMAAARHTGKLVLVPAVTPAPSIGADASYWITGGLGGLGLETARWLVSRGARHLVLSGRHAPGDVARGAVRELEAAGAVVRVEQADAADAARMAQVLADLVRDLPPLRGVIHAAGHVDDAVLQRQAWPEARVVWQGKAEGAWVLHRLTRELPLDFFVLYSAAGTLLGAPGQGVYPAANAALDALALARRRDGLPALSVAWGAWSGVGMAAAGRAADTWAARGLAPITPSTGFAALERLLADGSAHAAVLPIDWPRFLSQLPAGADAAFFGALAPTNTAAPARVDSVVDRIRGLPSGQRRQALVRHLAERSLQVLGLGAETPLDPKAALKDAGLDSLMAVELRNALTRSLGQPLPATLLFDYPTLEALSAWLMRTLGLEAEPRPLAAPPAPSAATDLHEMSDEEAEALLLKELEGGASTHP